MPGPDDTFSKPSGDADLLAAIVNTSSDAIVSKTLDGTVLSWNDAAHRIFGFSRDEMIGQSIRRIVPNELQGEEDEILERIARGETVPTFETLRLHQNGRTVPIAVTVSPIRAADGAIIGASKVARDISGEEIRRKALRYSEERFRMLADNIDQLAWITNASGWIEWYNKRWYEFTGTTLGDMRGWGWEKVHHPDHLERVKQIWTDALSKGEGWEDTFPLLGADGEYRWFLSRAHPVRDETGAIKYWFGTNTDITERRDFERRIQLLLGESNHRAKNMLAMIQALVHRTASESPQLVERLEQRIAAIASNHDLLVKSEWAGAQIRDVVLSQLVHVEDVRTSRIAVVGPPLLLSPAAAEAIGLAIHELATNAAKYGALSDDVGKVEITWEIVGEEAEERRFVIAWAEFDGPLVSQPASTGFGSMLIRRNPEIAFGAEVDIDFPPAGMRWKVDAPLDRVTFRDKV